MKEENRDEQFEEGLKKQNLNQNRKKMLKQEKKKNKKLNKEYSIVVYTFLILFLALIGNFVYFNIFTSQNIINNSFNKRQETYAKDTIKGDILDSAGNVLATTKTAKDGSESRYYPYGKVFAHVVGYSDKGNTGLESLANYTMLRSNSSILTRITNDLNDDKNQGDSLVTTLNADMQEAAYNALGASDGAVVVMEVKTGKILAMVSKPAYDPNTIAENWDTITKEKSDQGILLNRATQGLYPPGSIFKIFTLLEYIQENPGKYDNFEFVCKGSITQDDYTLKCYDGNKHGEEDLTKAFAKSCNSAFAQIGLDINNDKLRELCESALFNSNLPIDLPYSKSSMTLSSSDTDAKTMMTAIGQGETTVTPMHMAMITSAIANDGLLMTPYLIDHVQNDAGITVSSNSPKKYGNIFSSSDCKILQEYMKAVVNEGTATKLKNSKYDVAGKTGTAEYSSNKNLSHSWFIGYSSVDNQPDIAFAVIIEGGGAGSETAVPATKSILNAYYSK